MKNKWDRILLSLLWMVAVLLGACFWFNAVYAFNVFSGAHWQYLAGMQASQTAIAPGFYISFIVVAIIAVMGLYMLLRPRFKKIRPPKFAKQYDKNKPAITVPAPVVQPTAPVKQDIIPQDAPATAGINEKPSSESLSLRRPPRLNLGVGTVHNAYPAASGGTSLPAQTSFAPTSAATTNPAIQREIAEIFESAGYVSKGTPKIKGMQTSLFAIGTGEVLWIGAVGVTVDAMHKAVDAVSRVFTDTLEDIEIGINTFIISAANAPTENTDVLLFNNTDELRQYIAAHPNPPVPADDQGGFDAYSAYISTVGDYIGKI